MEWKEAWRALDDVRSKVLELVELELRDSDGAMLQLCLANVAETRPSSL